VFLLDLLEGVVFFRFCCEVELNLVRYGFTADSCTVLVVLKYSIHKLVPLGQEERRHLLTCVLRGLNATQGKTSGLLTLYPSHTLVLQSVHFEIDEGVTTTGRVHRRVLEEGRPQQIEHQG
jgi:hypothetical protein